MRIDTSGLKPFLRGVERWAVVRRILDAFADRGEVYAAIRLSRAVYRVRKVAGAQAGLSGLSILSQLAVELAKRGRLSRALAANMLVVDDLVQALGLFDIDVVRALHRQFQLLWRTGDTPQALHIEQQVLDLCNDTGADDTERLAAMSGQATVPHGA